ncbi:S1/P1 nuclease [Telmatocola sphagniphila]|uniref:S1/P1 nuclease n=1 Tax=Telmatocola sphagniphila TaxID=1123043 RepID=A0A8E6B5X5_9BACT|nr:S1/P1 nuclease [Telmatocola sphagniphila]QVL31731.1 S1/P1 nuclease [Telmatocola sphagniphila]
MKRLLFSLLTLILISPSAFAWNDKGHMVCSRLAWKQLSAEERTKITKILQNHPHYKEYLAANRPDNIPEDEWAFMRASTWADWVRNGPPERKAYNRGEWHYINIPYIPPGEDIKAPGAGEQNVVKQIGLSKKIVLSGGDRVEQAVHLTWLFHLITDMHQPLHCCTRFSKEFPEGDRGGNLSKVKLQSGGLIQLHSFWDGLLGRDVNNAGINSGVLDLEKQLEVNGGKIRDELDRHKTVEEWAQESFQQAVKCVYLSGDLKVVYAKTEFRDGEVKILDDEKKIEIPIAPKYYAQQAGDCARYQATKAGLRLSIVLKEIAAAN